MTWCTFPIRPITPDGSCSCGDPSCKDPGKHPAVKWGAKHLHKGESLPIPADHGVGIATGERSGIIVIDLDRKNGVDGITALLEMGSIPSTLAVDTPSGGMHLYFKWPGYPVQNSASVLGPGIDVRGDGGYVVAPPSRHKNGRHYEWVNEGTPIADAPAWLLDAIRRGGQSRVITRDRLMKTAAKWKRSSNPSTSDMGEALAKVCDGEAFALPGERDTVTFKLTKDLARAFPNADPKVLADLFVPSLSRMGVDAPDVEEKLERALDDADDWFSRLALADNGTPKACAGNASLVLENHPSLHGVLGFDARSLELRFMASPPWGGEPRAVRDVDGVACATWLTTEFRMAVTSATAYEALAAACQAHPFDRVKEYLEALSWDGRPRLDTWLSAYAGADDSPYVRAVGAAWCISAVARAMRPGAKVDTMLILQGRQGIGKSTAIEALVGKEFFCDSMPTIGQKDALLQIHGPWVIEVAELDAFDRREASAVKSFLSVCRDRFRAPYGRTVMEFPRSCVFAGTTNQDTYFTDDTGNRRFWPVTAARACDTVGLSAERDQIWAEAVTRYRSGEPWWLQGQILDLASDEQEARVQESPWRSTIEAALRVGVKTDPFQRLGGAPEYSIPPNCKDVSTSEVMSYVLGLPVHQMTSPSARRVAADLKALGFARYKESQGKRLARFRRDHDGDDGDVRR